MSATLQDELARLQKVHEKAMRAAQRQEDSRRKRLHFERINQDERAQLDETMETKHQQVVTSNKQKKLQLQQKLAERNRLIQRKAEQQADRRARIEQLRLQQVEETRALNDARVQAIKEKNQKLAQKRMRMKTRIMQRVRMTREEREAAKEAETAMVGEKMQERLSKTQKAQRAVIRAFVESKRNKNQNWDRRVQTVKATPDFKGKAIEARLQEKYDKIAHQKQVADTLAKHRRMLEIKLQRQKSAWEKEYTPSTKQAPQQARIASSTRVRKRDLMKGSGLPAFGAPAPYVSTTSPGSQRRPKSLSPPARPERHY